MVDLRGRGQPFCQTKTHKTTTYLEIFLTALIFLPQTYQPTHIDNIMICRQTLIQENDSFTALIYLPQTYPHTHPPNHPDNTMISRQTLDNHIQTVLNVKKTSVCSCRLFVYYEAIDQVLIDQLPITAMDACKSCHHLKENRIF